MKFASGSQNGRLLSEGWASQNLYCPNCGNARLDQFRAGQPLADFQCGDCLDQFELKSLTKPFGSKVIDGAYDTKMARLRSDTAPNLVLLQYDRSLLSVINLIAVPRRFFHERIIEKRPPLGPNARRAGWVGSNILLPLIPNIGRIKMVDAGQIVEKTDVLSAWARSAFLDGRSTSARRWLTEVMLCVDRTGSETFTLEDIYRQEAYLQELYPNNRNIRPKIRQQLQILRDNGYIEFLGSGRYRRSPS